MMAYLGKMLLPPERASDAAVSGGPLTPGCQVAGGVLWNRAKSPGLSVAVDSASGLAS